MQISKCKHSQTSKATSPKAFGKAEINMKKTRTGPSTPPIVERRGLTTSLPGGYKEPPGWTDSAISLTASPKKKAIKTWFTSQFRVTAWPSISKSKMTRMNAYKEPAGWVEVLHKEKHHGGFFLPVGELHVRQRRARWH